MAIDPERVTQLQKQMLADYAPDAALAVSPRRGERIEGEQREPPAFLDRAHQVQILHERRLRHASHLVEVRAAQEDGLITERQTQETTAKPGPPLDDPKRGAERIPAFVESKPEGPAPHLWIRERGANGLRVSHWQASVRMQEEDPLGLRRRGPSGQLARAPGSGLHDLRSAPKRPSCRVVATSTVNHDDADARSQRTGDGVFDSWSLVLCGDDDGDLHAATIA